MSDKKLNSECPVPVEKYWPRVQPPPILLTYRERLFLGDVSMYGFGMTNMLDMYEMQELARKILAL